MQKRVLFVVDVSNLYYCVGKRFPGRKLDYAKLYDLAMQDNEPYRAIAYGAAMNGEADAFKAAITRYGYEPKYMVPKLQGENRKADWDVGIAMDVVKMLDSVDIVVFGTADGDLAPCVEYVKSRGKQAFVIGCGISKDLKTAADRFIEIPEELLEC